jgi:hypothetical protein
LPQSFFDEGMVKTAACSRELVVELVELMELVELVELAEELV